MKRVIFSLLMLVLLLAAGVCLAEPLSEAQMLDELMTEADKIHPEGPWVVDYDSKEPRPHEDWKYTSGLVIGLYNIFGDQVENSLAAAQSGEVFHGIPNEWLAEDLVHAEKILLLRQVSVSTTGKNFKDYTIFAHLILADPLTGEILDQSYTPGVHLTQEEKDAWNLYSVDSCTQFLESYGDKQSHPDGYKDRYDEAMALYNDEKYYSARQAFIESEYGNWEEMAEKCIRRRPSTGELWHDPNVWVRDMYLTFRIDQPEDTSIFIRLYKDGNPVSRVFVAGPGETTVQLPGNGYYSIKDGIGKTWYGEKEAFGREGSYETMTFDDAGTEKVYLQSYYEYTISINVASTGKGIGSKDEDWDSFAE